MAIEDFEWEGEAEPLRPSQALPAASGDRLDTTAAGGWCAKLCKSVWFEPAIKLLGMGMLLGVLAGIGVVATTYAKPGLTLPGDARALANVLGTSWLKPSPPAAGAAPAPTPTPSAAARAAPAASALAPASDVAPGAGAAPAGMTADGKVILNLASADELTKLPGVGPKRALAIIALRTKLKRFKHPTDLLRVKGIGPRGLQRMLPHLVLDA